MKNKLIRIILLFLLIPLLCSPFSVALAEEEEQITPSDVLENLDLSELEKYYEEIKDNSFAESDLSDIIYKTVSGENVVKIEDLGEVIWEILGEKILSFLPFVVTLISLCVVLSLLGGVTFETSSSSVLSVVNFAGNLLISILVLCQTYYLILEISAFSGRISALSEAVFPILFTIMSSVGASGSVGFLSPTVAIFTGTILEIASQFMVPAVIVSLVISMIGGLSGSIQLNSLHKLIVDFCEWILKTSFFIFTAVMVIQGIAVGVSDGITQRISKFALSKYVPIIGGYLSEGFNYLIASSVLVKNAIGITSIIMLLIEFLPVFLGITAIKLSLKAVSAVAEPLGLSSTNSMLNKTAGSLSVLSSIVSGITFLYVIFIAIIMLIGNVVA